MFNKFKVMKDALIQDRELNTLLKIEKDIELVKLLNSRSAARMLSVDVEKRLIRLFRNGKIDKETMAKYVDMFEENTKEGCGGNCTCGGK